MRSRITADPPESFARRSALLIGGKVYGPGAEVPVSVLEELKPRVREFLLRTGRLEARDERGAPIAFEPYPAKACVRRGIKG